MPQPQVVEHFTHKSVGLASWGYAPRPPMAPSSPAPPLGSSRHADRHHSSAHAAVARDITISVIEYPIGRVAALTSSGGRGVRQAEVVADLVCEELGVVRGAAQDPGQRAWDLAKARPALSATVGRAR